MLLLLLWSRYCFTLEKSNEREEIYQPNDSEAIRKGIRCSVSAAVCGPPGLRGDAVESN
jgi:hypothetical protein